MEESINRRYSFGVREALDQVGYCFTITDPSIPGQPIVFASAEFLKLCGYSRQEVIGKNGRMFQGILTSRRSVMEIRNAIAHQTSLQVTLLNYAKNGTPYWILFHMFPVFSMGILLHFVGIQIPITSTPNPAAGDTRDMEKRRANTGMANILSMLKHYSHLTTGTMVSDTRHPSSSSSSSLNSLSSCLAAIKQSFVLTDPHQTIVYASDAFLQLTGYTRHQVLGQTSRFLSGHQTDLSTQLQITNTIQTGKPCNVCILNYRKDGTPFWNCLQISPVRNASGQIAYFVEVQMEKEVNAPPEKQQQQQQQQSLSMKMRQLSVVGAVKVAVRSYASDS